LTGIEIKPLDKGKAPVADRSAIAVPEGDVVALAPDAPAAAVAFAAPAAGAAVVVGPLAAVVVGVVAVVGVVVVVPVMVVSVGNETVGTLMGSDGTVIVVGSSPSAAAAGGRVARRKPRKPAVTSAENCSPKRSQLEPAMSAP
jgi:hypothetical protein